MTLASKRVKYLLDNYAEPSMEIEVKEELNAFVANKKASMPDSFT
jgi:trimethylamine--corrinoid protein Co-methyltransferase